MACLSQNLVTRRSKGIRPCMASYEGISVDTAAHVDVNIVEWYKGKLR